MCSAAEAVSVSFEGRAIPLGEGQTVLAALQAAGVEVESSCRAGVCQSCLMQVVEGEAPRPSQAGLSAGQLAQGLFMPCVCVPQAPLVIARADSARQRVEATVEATRWLSSSVLQVKLRPGGSFSHRPGQFVSLIAEGGLIRSYSIASTPEQFPLIDLHVRILPEGRMGARLMAATPGDRLTLSGPSGSCCYDGIDADRALVLAGTGTGLAPLWAVLNEALSRGHRGPIALYHGALSSEGLYLVDELRALERRHPAFAYHPVVRSLADPTAGDLVATVAGAGLSPDAAYFLCGDAGLVKRLQRTLFIGGVKLDRIRADPFVAAAAA